MSTSLQAYLSTLPHPEVWVVLEDLGYHELEPRAVVVGQAAELAQLLERLARAAGHHTIAIQRGPDDIDAAVASRPNPLFQARRFHLIDVAELGLAERLVQGRGSPWNLPR